MSLTSVVFGALYSFSFDHAFYFRPRGFCFAGKVLTRQHVMHRVTLGTRHKGECSRKVISVTSVVCLDLIRLD